MSDAALMVDISKTVVFSTQTVVLRSAADCSIPIEAIFIWGYRSLGFRVCWGQKSGVPSSGVLSTGIVECTLGYISVPQL